MTASPARSELIELMTSVPALDPQVWFAQSQGTFGLVTHVPFPTLNGVWIHSDEATADDVSQLLEALPTDDAFCLQACPETRDLAAEVAVAHGMTAGPNVPLMVLPSPPEDIDARLRIREIPPADYDLRTAVAAAGFETDPDGLRKATRLFSRVPGYRMYIGEVDDITVTTAVSIATGSGVGIFDVATPPEHRGHGYGAAITARAVRDGFTAGARFAWLQSSPEGFGVYERLGFQTVEEWGLWISG